MKKILITGAGSAIAQATARRWAKEGAAFFLIDKDSSRTVAVGDDLKVRGAGQVITRAVDLNDVSAHQDLVQHVVAVLGGLDVVLIAHGTLPKQADCEKSWELTARELATNFLSAASLLTHLANYFEQKNSGTLVVISSVAGDRGRQSNYVYGSAKGALTIFASGLRNRLHKKGVQVVTIKPGFVDTPMTAEFKKGLLWVKPAVIARGIDRAVKNRADVVYLPSFWRIIMVVIRAVPERIFKRLSL